ncbi:MAG TPA: hypothetical protein VF669_11795 [Tepidisphaeraceae bacterium]|jgi:hypothetical protein
MSEQLTVSDAARELGANPRDITNAFYDRLLRDDIAPIIGGRRMIPRSYLDVIAMVLRRAGKLPQNKQAEGHEVAHA